MSIKTVSNIDPLSKEPFSQSEQKEIFIPSRSDIFRDLNSNKYTQSNLDFSQILSPEGQQKLIQGKTLFNLSPNDINISEECKQIIREDKITKTIYHIKYLCVNYFKKLSRSCAFETLDPEISQKLNEEIEHFARQISQLTTCNEHLSGEEILKLMPEYSREIDLYPKDFGIRIFFRQGHLGNEKSTKINLMKLYKRYYEENDLLIRKDWKKIDLKVNPYSQLKSYLTAAKKLGKDIDQLSDQEFDAIEQELANPDKAEKTAAVADATYEALMREEGEQKPLSSANSPMQASSKKAKKIEKGRNENKAAVVQRASKAVAIVKEKLKVAGNLLQGIALKLCKSKYPSLYKLHPRITRWSINDLAIIESWEGFQGLSKKELKYQRAAHYLSGIERILSEETLVEKYTFNSTYRDNDGNSHTGKSLYVRMIDSEGNSFEGIVRVAINQEGVIYHAMLEKIGNGFSLANLKAPIEFQNEPEDPSWQNVSQSTFSIGSNQGVEDVLILQNGRNKKEQVTYQFYPLE